MTTSMDASALTIRPAQPGDVSVAVGLLYLTMHGLADYIFGCDPRRPTLEVVQALFLHPDNRLSHRHAAVIEADAAPAGLLVAYPGRLVPALDRRTGGRLLRRFSPAAFVRLIWRSLALPGEEARRDEYYISNLGVLPQLQGRGIGSRLLAFAEKEAPGGRPVPPVAVCGHGQRGRPTPVRAHRLPGGPAPGARRPRCPGRAGLPAHGQGARSRLNFKGTDGAPNRSDAREFWLARTACWPC